jgi:hypothetical protein
MTDRWCELDIRVFHPDRLEADSRAALDRMHPLLTGGDSGGVVLCCGWLADLALVFTGDPGQALPWSSRHLEAWRGRTYRDLARLVTALREAAAAIGLPWVRIGCLFVGAGRFVFPKEQDLYDFEGVFLTRHPECYATTGGAYDVRALFADVPLAGDRHPYAAFPQGLPAGTRWAGLFGAQWSVLARAVGFTALVLRDGLPGSPGTPATPQRTGGARLLIELVRAVKSALPEGLVIGYSGARDPLLARRLEGFDLAQVAADGHLDAWITQSWGCAWQDWWNSPSSGWTFQLANILADRLAVRAAGSHCRHYHLIETVDGFETWDTIHRYPGKLAWACQAFAHAATITADGRPRGADGVYVSWLNDRHGDLLSAADCSWLGGELDRADRSLVGLDAVHGAVLVADPPAIDRLAADTPAGHAGELLYDHAGFFLKYGLPIAAAALQAGSRPGAILGLPGGPVDAAPPWLLIGRADLLPAGLLAACGVRCRPGLLAHEAVELTGPGLPPGERVQLPDRPPVEADQVILRAGDPVLAGGRDGLWLQPPARHAVTAGMLSPNLLGSFQPYRAAAQALAAHLDGPQLEPVAIHEPLTFLAWTSGGRLHLLLGNLESGYTGDARHPRTATIRALPPGQQFTDADDASSLTAGADGRLQLIVPAEGRRLLLSAIARLRDAQECFPGECLAVR